MDAQQQTWHWVFFMLGLYALLAVLFIQLANRYSLPRLFGRARRAAEDAANGPEASGVQKDVQMGIVIGVLVLLVIAIVRGFGPADGAAPITPAPPSVAAPAVGPLENGP